MGASALFHHVVIGGGIGASRDGTMVALALLVDDILGIFVALKRVRIAIKKDGV